MTAVAGVGLPGDRRPSSAIAWETGLFASPAAAPPLSPAAAPPLSPAAAPPRTVPSVSREDEARAWAVATVDDLVDEARLAYDRVSARAAYQAALHHRAVIVDIRPEAQRLAKGEVHPDLRPVVIERNVLEWRLDPRSPARLPWVSDETRIVVLCQEGYASSLAAASLARLGLRHVTDIEGGLAAWRSAGLPVA